MRRWRPGRGWTFAWIATLGAAACGAPPEGGEAVVFETEEIGSALEDELDLSTDRKAAPRASSSGKLPGHFPEGLPVYKPSTISDLGVGERGDFVQFMSQDGADEIRAWYRTALSRAGWSVERASGGALVVVRGQRRAIIKIEASGPVTFVRVEY